MSWQVSATVRPMGPSTEIADQPMGRMVCGTTPGEGLKPTSRAKRVAFDGPNRTVIDGPFAATSELVAGFWIWKVKDMDEAVAWVKRCPNPMPGPSEIEIRPVYEMADFGDAVTPEVSAIHERARAKSEKR